VASVWRDYPTKPPPPPCLSSSQDSGAGLKAPASRLTRVKNMSRARQDTMSTKKEEVRFVVACVDGPLTAQTFATQEEAMRALDSLARTSGARQRDPMFVRQTTWRDRHAYKHMAGWAGFERQ
jgi:hypothetical protein